MNLSELKQRLLEITSEGLEIINRVQRYGRDLNEAEVLKLQGLDSEYKTVEQQVKNLERGYTNTALGRQSDPDEKVMNSGLEIPNGSRITAVSNRGSHDFRSFGEFASAVYASGRQGSHPDRRLFNAPTTVSTEGVGADGGYLVPPDYRNEILRALMDEYQILGLCDKVETKSNQLIFPADESTAWGATGIQSYWTGENQQMTQSKPELKQKEVKLNKIYSLVPITSEMLEDSASVDAYLRRRVPETLNFKISEAIVHGTGAGEPQGILNCGCKIQVNKESGQSADSLMAENILAMWSRLYPPCHARAVWLCHPDAFPQLASMFLEGTSSSIPMWMPANGQAGTPHSTLMGRPVIFSQVCETVGDVGDLILADFSQYLVGLKTTGIRTDVSIHLWFDYDVLAFRFVMRVGGQCWWSAAIDPRDGSNTMSAFITLQART